MTASRVFLSVLLAIAFLLPAAGLATAGPPAIPLEKVCLGGAFGTHDATAMASNNVPNDVPVADDRMHLGTFFAYYGLSSPFNGLGFNVGMPGTGPGRVDWFYWDGADWAELSVNDGTNHFQNAGKNKAEFTAPVDWAIRNVANLTCGGTFYWVKTTTGFEFDQLPLATRVVALA